MNAEQHTRLKNLFEQARSLSPDEQKAFIAQAAADDSELRQELEMLLQYDHSQTLVPRPLGDSAGSSAPDLSASFSVPARPSRLSLVPRTHVAILASSATLVVILIAGTFLHRSVSQQLLTHQAAQLESQCHSTAMAISNLLDANIKLAESWSIDPELATVVERAGRDQLPVAERTLERQCPTIYAKLQRQWGNGFTCVIWNRERIKILATENNHNSMLASSTQTGAQLLNRVFNGDSVVFLPNSLETISQGYHPPAGKHLMSYIVPLQPPGAEQPIGAMLIRNQDLEDQFHQTFAGASFLRTGESYAFTDDGRMISRPRFPAQLDELKLLESPENLPSTRYVTLRDPGGDLTEGYHPTEARVALPETELVRGSRARKTGVNVRGYRDYRGRRVFGAWEWIDRYNFGIATEIDEAEISEPYRALNLAFLSAGGLIIFATSWVIGSQLWTRHRRRSAGREYRRIGPYHLEKQIGEGGMGKVFKAQHDLLKRPTALKILKPELASETALRRFSREVQFACQLHHPNTVDIYDYGCTTDGQFYYAMEFLSGLSLQELVQKFGPLPYPRGLYLLRQLCGSLGEAHRAGFVHRDVKPRNIMVCNCGGEADFVKVVDFGLVKSSEPRPESGDTTVGEWAGTPRYIAPERLLQPRIVDPRSDIYSVGVTMYWAFTGTEAFAGDGLDALLTSIMSEPPRPIAARFAMPAVLQEILQKCLAKIPADRFQTIDELEAALAAVPNPEPWTPEKASLWWQTHLPHLSEIVSIPEGDSAPIPANHLSQKSKISG